MDITHIMGVVVGEGQSLQVVEHRVFHVSSDIQFDLSDEIAGNDVADDLQKQYQKVQQDECRQSIQRPQRNIVIDGIAVKQRVDGVCHTGQCAQQDHHQHADNVGTDKGDHLPQSKKAGRGVFHTAASSPTDWISQMSR